MIVFAAAVNVSPLIAETSDLPVSKPSIVTEPLSVVPSRSAGDLLGKSSQEPLCKRPLGRFPEV